MAKVYLEPQEVALIEQAASNLRDRLLVRLLFYLGGRVSEVLSIGLDDIDLSACTVTIKHLKTRLKLSCHQCGAGLGKSHIYCPKCGIEVEQAIAAEKEHRRVRTLPLDDGTLKLLREYISRGGPITREGKTYILDITRFRAWQIIRDCAQKAGLSKLVNSETSRVHNVSPHKLRDAFAIHAMKLNDSGDGMRLLQQHLGHQSFNTTAKYRKISGEEQREWYDKLWSEEKP